MKGFFRETQKTLFRFPCFVILIGALLLNACLLYTNAADPFLENSSIKKANAYLSTLSQNEILEFISDYQSDLENGGWNQEILFSNDVQEELRLMQKYANYALQLEEYPDYLQSIQNKAAHQEIAIFQNTSEFTKRDLTAAAKAFAPLKNAHLQFVSSDAVLEATEFAPTDLFILAVLFYFVISMIIYEKEHGLFRLLRSAKNGRGPLIRAKMASGAFSSILLTLLFWGENLGIAILKYGAYDFSAPLQSVYGYDGSALPVTIGQYLILFLCSKMAVYTFIGFFILLLGIKASNTMEIYLGVCFTVVFSVLCDAIGTFSKLHILHYANLIFFTRVTSFYRFYFNLNFFQYPVSIAGFSIFCIALLLALLWYLNWKSFTAKNFAAGIKRGWKRKKDLCERPNVSVISHEFYKIFISCHGFLLLGAFLIFTIWMYRQSNFKVSQDELHYKNYMEYMAGDLTQEKEDFLKQEQEMFKKYEALLEEKQTAYDAKTISEAEMVAVSQLVSQKIQPKNAFMHLLDRVDYAKAHQTPLIYESGYLELFGYGYSGYLNDMKHAVFLILVLILLIVPYIAGEYSQGMMKLISTQYAGRSKTLSAKEMVCLFAAIIVFLLAYVPQLIYIGTVYGYKGLNENIRAIPELESGIPNCSIWTYLTLIYALRLLMCCATVFLAMAVSVYRKNIAQVVSGLLFILVFPLGLHILGISITDRCSLNAFYSVNQILNQKNAAFLILEICVCIIFISASVIYLKATMGKETS